MCVRSTRAGREILILATNRKSMVTGAPGSSDHRLTIRPAECRKYMRLTNIEVNRYVYGKRQTVSSCV